MTEITSLHDQYINEVVAASNVVVPVVVLSDSSGCVGKEKNVIKNFLDGGGNDTGGGDWCDVVEHDHEAVMSSSRFNAIRQCN